VSKEQYPWRKSQEEFPGKMSSEEFTCRIDKERVTGEVRHLKKCLLRVSGLPKEV